VDYAPRAVAVAELTAEVEPLVLPQLGAKALAFTREVGPPGLCAHADPEKGRQILLNLLANAIKFTDRGGRVWLTADAAGDWVEIAVHDTGIGIPADRLASVFDPFVQVHRSLSRPVDGTGLGLAISRDLARGMGGDITVVSEPGRGSTFTLRLPRSTPAAR
jgi:signal transduction histidine kinase